jgi:hypothetical protein
VDVSKVHVHGLRKFVSQMSTFGDVHAWTFLKSTPGPRFSAGLGPFLAKSVASLDEICAKNEHNRFFKSKFFL